MHVRPLSACLLAMTVLSPVPGAAQAPAGLPPLQPAPSAAPAASTAPPPDRVGRVAAVTGAVSFHLAGATEWQVARSNLPVTTGTALWVAAGGEAGLGVADNRAVLAGLTELDVDLLDDQSLAATQAQGESCWLLHTVRPGETYTVRTPRGIVTIATAGRYGIVSGDVEHPTVITVLDGAATLTGLPSSHEVGAGQSLTVTGDGNATPFAAAPGPAAPDAFLQRCGAGAPSRPRPPLAPAVLASMTGAEPLYEVGEWTDNAEYGPVWYPPVATYVPYRQGRWAYVAPWGWTWVDDAPWGFAPSHYGRWAQFGERWGWVPGRDWQAGRVPAYAPALVGFLGGAALGSARAPLVGWAPLGPRETYRPSYPVDERRLAILNGPTGAPLVFNNAPVTFNRAAVTVVPRQVLTGSAPVGPAWRANALPATFRSAPVQFQPGAAPTRSTIGATNALLRQVNPAGLAAPAAHAGPGPGFGPGALRGGGPGAERVVRPGQASVPVGRPAAPGRAGPGGGPASGPGEGGGFPGLRGRDVGPPGGAERGGPGRGPGEAGRGALPRVQYGTPAEPGRTPDVRYGAPMGGPGEGARGGGARPGGGPGGNPGGRPGGRPEGAEPGRGGGPGGGDGPRGGGRPEGAGPARGGPGGGPGGGGLVGEPRGERGGGPGGGQPHGGPGGGGPGGEQRGERGNGPGGGQPHGGPGGGGRPGGPGGGGPGR